MKKSVLSIMLVIIGLLSFSIFCKNNVEKEAQEPIRENTVQENEKEAPEFNVYYFHGSMRCITCRRIEQYTKETIETDFAEAIREGLVVFREMNMETKENKHYVNEFQLYTQSVVLTREKDGKILKWKNLDQIWNKVKKQEDFKKYIHEETENFMKEEKQ